MFTGEMERKWEKMEAKKVMVTLLKNIEKFTQTPNKQEVEFLSGKIVTFYTSLCLLNTKTEQVQECVIEFEVKYKALNQKIIESYLLNEQPYNCVGSVKSEGLGITLLEYIKGEDPTALIGLPLIKLSDMLQNEGVVF